MEITGLMNGEGRVLLPMEMNVVDGVGVLVRPGAGIALSGSYADPNGRFITTEIQFNNKVVTLGNIYGPNADDCTVFETFF